MRGLAVLIMFECHTFNSFARLDVRNGGPYVLSQFVGGMAAPLFLFMAGMTFGFQMESLERRQPNRWRRWLVALRRAGYIMAIAFAFRICNWIASMPRPEIAEITKVDILNSMALAMGAFAAAALFDGKHRVRFALAGALGLCSRAASASPEETGSPTFLCSTIPTAGSTESSLRSRPPPRITQAVPTCSHWTACTTTIRS